MKHIFYVHSGITYLVSMAVIDYLKLELNEVVIIIGRSVKVDVGFLSVKLNCHEEELALLPSYGNREVLKKLKVLHVLDQNIADATDENNFTLYLPSEKNYLMQFLQSHRLCVKRNFIEEGLLTYRAGFIKPRLFMNSIIRKCQYLIRFPFHLGRANGVRPYAEKEFTVYVATRTALQALHEYNTVLLDISKVKIKMPATPSFKAVHIFDAVVEMNLCSKDNFLRCLEEFISQYVPREGLAIKFHPFQKEYDQYLAIYDKYGVQYTLLGPNVIPEVLLAEQQHIAVYGLTSSVLFYGKEMGHEVHSFSSALAKQDQTFRNYVTELIPAGIINYLKLI